MQKIVEQEIRQTIATFSAVAGDVELHGISIEAAKKTARLCGADRNCLSPEMEGVLLTLNISWPSL